MITVRQIEDIIHEELSAAEMFTWHSQPSESDLEVCRKIAERVRDMMEST